MKIGYSRGEPTSNPSLNRTLGVTMIDPRDPRLIAGVIGAILVVVAVSVWFVYDQTFVELYWREIAGPRVETELGFRLEYVPTEIPGRDHMYVITQVTPVGGSIEPVSNRAIPCRIGLVMRHGWIGSTRTCLTRRNSLSSFAS